MLTCLQLSVFKVIESIVVVDLDEDDRIVRLVNQWNGEDLPSYFGSSFLRTLNAKLAPWLIHVPAWPRSWRVLWFLLLSMHKVASIPIIVVVAALLPPSLFPCTLYDQCSNIVHIIRNSVHLWPKRHIPIITYNQSAEHPWRTGPYKGP